MSKEMIFEGFDEPIKWTEDNRMYKYTENQVVKDVCDDFATVLKNLRTRHKKRLEEAKKAEEESKAIYITYKDYDIFTENDIQDMYVFGIITMREHDELIVILETVRNKQFRDRIISYEEKYLEFISVFIRDLENTKTWED